MNTTGRYVATLAAGALLALGGSACSNSGTAPVTPALSQTEADSLAIQLSNDAGALAEGAVYSTGTLPFTPAPVNGASGSPASPQQCQPTLSPMPPANSDSDGVPDSVRIDFTGCVISLPTQTITLSGTIDKIDPTPTSTDHAVKTVYTDFTRSVERLLTGKTASITENGTRQFTGSSSQLTHTETDFTTDFTYEDGATAQHVKNWNGTFTADVQGSIKIDSLPSGLWHIDGTSTWTMANRSWSVQVTTNPDLHYNADCTDAPRFDAGTLTAVVTKTDATSTVTIQYTACGQYTVARS